MAPKEIETLRSKLNEQYTILSKELGISHEQAQQVFQFRSSYRHNKSAENRLIKHFHDGEYFCVAVDSYAPELDKWVHEIRPD